MPRTLGQVLQDARVRKGWSLREAEEKTGIHNAHISQIESGKISRPAPALLWSLSNAYGIEYPTLMRLAGHVTKDPEKATRRALAGAALHALEDLSPEEQRQVLRYVEKLRKDR